MHMRQPKQADKGGWDTQHNTEDGKRKTSQLEQEWWYTTPAIVSIVIVYHGNRKPNSKVKKKENPLKKGQNIIHPFMTKHHTQNETNN